MVQYSTTARVAVMLRRLVGWSAGSSRSSAVKLLCVLACMHRTRLLLIDKKEKRKEKQRKGEKAGELSFAGALEQWCAHVQRCACYVCLNCIVCAYPT